MATVSSNVRFSLRTPQAQDDLFGYSEDTLTSTTVYLNVIANDLGGAAKSLYSVGSTTSVLGASIKIYDDGTIAYNATLIASILNQLGSGEHATDSFTYSIQLGNGTLSWATVTIDLVGTNDAPIIVSVEQSGSVTEDGGVVASGQVQANDVDHGASLIYAGSAAGAYGSFVVDASTGTWEYTLDNNAPAIQAMIDGDLKAEQFTVTVTDEFGAQAAQTVEITIHGHTDGQIPVAQDVTANGNENAVVIVVLAGLNVDGTASYTFASLPSDGILYSDGELDSSVETGVAYANKTFYFVPDENFTGSASFQYTITDSQGETDPTPATVTINIAPVDELESTSGTAVDGYIVGATVFADANFNGVRDPGEASTTTGANGQFTLVGGSGPLVLIGGTDASTGLAFEGVLKAPAGSGVVTPLTTLIAALMEDGADAEDAQNSVKAALGLTLTNDLTTFDPVQQALDGNADALSVYVAGVQVQNIIVLAAEATGTSVADAAAATFDALSAAVTASAPIDLMAPSTELLEAIAGSASDPGALELVISALNTAVSDAAGAGDNFSALTQIAQVAVVAQGDSAADAASGADTTAFVTNLDTTIAAAEVGVVGMTTVGTSGDDVLNGGAGNDSIDGLTGRDTIHGDSGDDFLFGGSGGDLLFGDEGEDHLFGGSESDRLTGGMGIDVLDGGENPLTQLADTDRADYAAEGGPNGVIVNLSGVAIVADIGAGNVTVAAHTARDSYGYTDTLINIEAAVGTQYDDVLVGGDQSNFGTSRAEQFEGRGGNDTIIGGIDNNYAVYDNAAAGVHVDLALGQALDDGDGGVDTLINLNRIRGSAHADLLEGSDTVTGSERFEGGAGDDTINGRGGIDYVMYGNATSAVSVTFNADGSGSASDGYGTTDTFTGIEGVRGSAFGDTLTGSDRNDNVVERYEGMAGSDVINGGLGLDQVEFGQSPTRVIVNLSAAAVTVGADTVASLTALDGFGYVDMLTGIERAVGSRFDDYMVGDNVANRFDGGVGNDTLLGGDGNDTLVGGDGFDTLDGGAGTADRADYSAATGSVSASLAAGGAINDGFGKTDVFVSIEQVTGSAFNDILTGNASGNRLDGSAGDDILDGGGGVDTLLGGVGNDTLWGGLGNDTLQGGTGDDLFIGGSNVDIFRWVAGDQGTAAVPAVDTISDFDSVLNGDKLDLAGLLVGEHQNATSLDAYLDFILNGTDTLISVKSTGTTVDQQVILDEVNLFLLGGTDQDIITGMLTNGKLLVDL